MVRLTKKPGKGKMHCPNCSKIIASGYRLCPKCGHNLRGVNGLVPVDAPDAVEHPPAIVKADDAVGTVQAAISFAMHCGGIPEAARILEALRVGIEQLA
jgi:hypothetical protein